MKLSTYLIRRTLMLIPTLIGLTLIVFILSRAGGIQLVISAYINPHIPYQVQYNELVKEFHLNDPLWVQYYYYLVSLFQGNWGYTRTAIYTGPVIDAITIFLPNTIQLSIVAFIIAVLIGIPAGTVSGVKKDSLTDQITRVIAFVGISLPVFWLAQILSLAFVRHVILPATTLAFTTIAPIMRYMRASMVESMNQDYVKTARSKGIPEKIVIKKHARRNALIPVTTVLGLIFAGLLGGVVVIEEIFNYPGMGYWTVQALINYDTGGIMGSTLLFGLILVTANFVVDLLYAYIDPRIRLGE